MANQQASLSTEDLEELLTPKPIFWNNTLIGQLIPFTLKGYALSNDGQIPEVDNKVSIFQKYKSDSFALYSKT